MISYQTRLLATVAAVAGLIVGLAVPAQANDYNVNPVRCSTGYTFKFQLFYNSDFRGSWAKFGYSEENFGAHDGTPGYLIFTFCEGRGNGSGQQVKNNAASAHNHKDYGLACTARVYFNSNWKGIYDDIGSDHYRNLVKTYNENASFKWIGSQC